MAPPTHALAPPFHLPGNQDATLLASLKDERWAEAVTLLRDVVTAETTEPKWLFLLAYSRFRDACEVMFEERLSAAQEALRLLDRAVAAGLPLREVAPFRREVETVLDQETRAELATLAKLPEPGQSLEGVDTEVLTDAGYTLWSSEPRRAGECFEEVARRQRGQTPDLSVTSQVRAAQCYDAAHDFARAKPLYELALATDWGRGELREERSLAEKAVTALLVHSTGAEREALWQLGTALGVKVKLPFPSIWPNQEALLRHCIEQKDWVRARFLADRIEETRDVLPKALTALIARTRRDEQ